MAAMTHRQAQAAIRSAMVRAPGDREPAGLAEHLAGCPDCRTYARELDSLRAVLPAALRSRWGAARPQAVREDRVQANLERRLKMKSFRRGLGAMIGIGVLLAVLIGVSMFAQAPQTPLQALTATAVETALKLAPTPTGTPTHEPALPTPAPTPPPPSFPIGKIIFKHHIPANGSSRVYLANSDGTGLEKFDPVEGFDVGSFAWSPDGTALAFVGSREMELGYLSAAFVMDVQSSTVRPVTPLLYSLSQDSRPAWSPDGKQLLLLASTGLYRVDASGAGLRWAYGSIDPVWWETTLEALAAWNEALSSALEAGQPPPIELPGPYGQWDKARITLSGLEALASHALWQPAFSPDGQSITLRDTNPYGGIYPTDLIIARADGSDLRRVNTEAYETREHYNVIRYTWSPDGSRLAYFLTSRDHPLELWIYDGLRSTAVLPLDVPLGLADVSDLVERGYKLAWSPDGTRLAFAVYHRDPVAEKDIYVVNADGTRLQKLRFPGQHPVWLSDDWLMFSDKSTLYAVPVENRLSAPGSTDPQQILTFPDGEISSLDWQP